MIDELILELDDNINDYLPFEVYHPDYPDSIITFRQILTHTASLNENWQLLDSLVAPGDSPIPLGEFVKDYLTPEGQYYNAERNFHPVPPGTEWNYSTFPFALLGYIIEEISGIPYHQYVQENLLDPLGMDESSYF